MARLRKANSPTDAPIVLPPTTTRITRSSPRKAPHDTEDSLLVPKRSTSDTPKKQRILRPVASNSRLVRSFSNDRSERPEKDSGSSRAGYSYSKILAKTMAKRQGEKEKEVKEVKLVKQIDEVEETALDEDEEADQSLWCGDEEEPASEEKELKFSGHEEEEGLEEQKEECGEDDDEDPVVDVRIRRRQTQRQASQPFDDDPESINIHRAQDELIKVQSRREQIQPQPVRPEPVQEMLPPLKPPHRKGHSTVSNWAQEVVDLTGSPEPPVSFVLPPLTRPASFAASSRPTSSSSDYVDAMLTYSPTPTKQRSPRKAPPTSRPSTPPLPPASPSKLISPSKKKNRIPHAPDLRPSLDAFWAADVVNTWNDKHSPSKPLLSPRKQRLLKDLELLSESESDASFSSPTTSPRKKKTATQSPVKSLLDSTTATSSPSIAQVRAQRKQFATTKHALAEFFLAEIDNTVTGGRIASMSRPTGGIKLIWSKTLKTTAGRANWRREQLRLRTGPLPTDIKTEYRHHCSIELAEKVIDDEERLYNVLAHEYCHLTTFMISEIRNNPHGAEFKSWGEKVTRAFRHKGVEVTTKHSYQIDYKYVWECLSCSYLFKRHSKSVDPSRHSCGRCKGRLVQIKPAPRGGAKDKNGKPREKSEYQVYVKENFGRVKKRLEAEGRDTQMGKVMAAVAEEYKAQKERKAGGTEKGVVEVENLLEGLRIEDDDI